jgi:hypothetical protein
VLLRWKKERQHSGDGYTRIWHTNEDFLRRRESPGHEDGRSRALFSGRKVRFFLGESQVADSSAVGRRQAGKLDRTISENFAPELLRNLSSSERHGGMARDLNYRALKYERRLPSVEIRHPKPSNADNG